MNYDEYSCSQLIDLAVPNKTLRTGAISEVQIALNDK